MNPCEQIQDVEGRAISFDKPIMSIDYTGCNNKTLVISENLVSFNIIIAVIDPINNYVKLVIFVNGTGIMNLIIMTTFRKTDFQLECTIAGRFTYTFSKI